MTYSEAADISMLAKPQFVFPLKVEEYAGSGTPLFKDWVQLWAAWDTVTKGLIPAGELLSKPIELRNPYIFYLGHIPTFLDLQLARATDGPFTIPSSYRRIFERGMDPDVENPKLCHPHSEVPEIWPAREDILDFQGKLRDRVKQLYQSGRVAEERRLGRALWLSFEHEAMHLETLLYMLLQSEKALPPFGAISPDFASLAHQAELTTSTNGWFTIPAAKLTLGMGDSENSSSLDHFFGWDNEKPSRHTTVESFLARPGPITNGEYARYLERTRNNRIPASWSEKIFKNGISSENSASSELHGANGTPENGALSKEFLGGKFARTIYGAVPLAQALHWPVYASYDELAGYAKWMEGRIPTQEEVRSIYHFVDQENRKEAAKVLSKTIAAVNGRVQNISLGSLLS